MTPTNIVSDTKYGTWWTSIEEIGVPDPKYTEEFYDGVRKCKVSENNTHATLIGLDFNLMTLTFFIWF